MKINSYVISKIDGEYESSNADSEEMSALETPM